MIYKALLILFLCISHAIFSDESIPFLSDEDIFNPSFSVPIDSLYISPPYLFEPDDDLTTPYTFELPKNPLKAGLLSAVVPGAGQVYNEKYLKASGVIAIQAYLIGMTVYNDKKTKEYRNKMDTSEGLARIEYQALYEDYHERRQSSIYWVGASIFISAMEAFVDAHLINFNDKKNEVRLKFTDQKVIVSVSF